MSVHVCVHLTMSESWLRDEVRNPIEGDPNPVTARLPRQRTGRDDVASIVEPLGWLACPAVLSTHLQFPFTSEAQFRHGDRGWAIHLHGHDEPIPGLADTDLRVKPFLIGLSVIEGHSGVEPPIAAEGIHAIALNVARRQRKVVARYVLGSHADGAV